MSSHFQFLTAAGPAAIALVRLQGPAVPAFLARHIRWTSEKSHDALTAGQVERITLVSTDGETIDDAVLSVHGDAPSWDIRLHLHGGTGLRKRVADLLEQAGFVLMAEHVGPWSPTDLFESEVLLRLPEMLTEAGVQWLLTQPALLRAAVDELMNTHDLDAARFLCASIAERAHWVSWFTTPLKIAIAGEPNTGKSTLVNALAERSVSLVSPTVGTTRDWVAASGEIDGFPVEWLDTAGLFAAKDALDAAGVARTREVLKMADLVALAVPLDQPPEAVWAAQNLLERRPDVVVRTFADRVSSNQSNSDDADIPVVHVAAPEGRGLAAFTAALLAAGDRRLFRPDLPVALTPEMAGRWGNCSQAIDLKSLRSNPPINRRDP